MNRFKPGIMIKIIYVCILAIWIPVYFWDERLYVKIAWFVIFILFIISVIGIFTEEYVVEEDRLVYKSIYKTTYVYWKDVRVISLTSFACYNIEKRPHIWIQKTEDVMNCKLGKTMGIPWAIKDYKVLVRMIVEKCKDNKQAYVEQSVLKLISESLNK